MSNNMVCQAAGLNTTEFRSRGFKVYETVDTIPAPLEYARRDVYKIVLASGNMTICYGDQTIQADGVFLTFLNPHVPYSVTHHSIDKKGYACVFTEAFIEGREWIDSLQRWAYFRFKGTPVIPVKPEQATFLTGLYQKMLSVQDIDYQHKDEILKRCIELIFHEALSLQPTQNGTPHKNAATRITYLFSELLEKQFPIESTASPLKLRTALDFAKSLAVHVNYLNRSVKEVTGKPISIHISERIVAEAKALLQHTNWSVADIAYTLGFEYPTYFNNYFKRVTGVVPKSFRK